MRHRNAALFAAALLLVEAQPGLSALWNGETAGWRTDHWGLSNPVGSPGDENYPAEIATIDNGGEVVLADNDLIEVESLLLTKGTIRQKGGTLLVRSRANLRAFYHLEDGALTNDENGSYWWLSRGAEFNISGGEFAPPANPVLDFGDTGDATVRIRGGRVEVHTFNLYSTAKAAGNAVLQIIGTGSQVSAKFLNARQNSGAGRTSTLSFVFDSSGVTPLIVTGGGNNFTLGEGDDRGQLEAEVSAVSNDGSTAYPLIQFRGTITGEGSFSNIAVHSGTTTLTRGKPGALKPGEFALTIEGGTKSEVLLYFNNSMLQPRSR